MKIDSNKICVLVVDDDESIREAMGMVLESEGFECHTAIDGQDAIAQIARSKLLPDLVITDMMMPQMTGWELVDILRKVNRTQKIPIIVYSGVAHYIDENKTLDGCYFLRKPVALDLLFSTIKKALSTPTKNGGANSKASFGVQEHDALLGRLEPKPLGG